MTFKEVFQEERSYPIGHHWQKAVLEITLSQVPLALQEKCLKGLGMTKDFEVNALTIRRKGHFLDVSGDTILQKGRQYCRNRRNQNIKDLFGRVKKTANEGFLIDSHGSNAMYSAKLFRILAFLAQKTMRGSGLKERYPLNAVMLRRNGGSMPIKRKAILAKNDEIVLFGDYGKIKPLYRFMEGRRAQR